MDSGIVAVSHPTTSHINGTTPNGMDSPPLFHTAAPSREPLREESDLSDLHDAPAEHTSSPAAQHTSSDEDVDAIGEADSSQDEDAEGEADEDYNLDTPVVHAIQSESSSRAPSEESRRPAKRKASTDDEDYLKDPELYGLRRSGRARLNRRVVDSTDDEDEDDMAPKRKKRRSVPPAKGSHQHTPAVASAIESGSESDAYVGGKRDALTKKQRQRQLQVAAGLAPPSAAEVRFSTRRAAKVQTYNEEEDDLLLEDDDDVLMANHFVAPEDNSPAIDVVLKHRLKAVEGATDPGQEHEAGSADALDKLDKHSYDFLIKWTGSARYHATWEPFPNLMGLKGFKRINTYWTKFVDPEVRIMDDPDTPPEEKEAFNLDRERRFEMLEDSKLIERVISSREDDEGVEYYVKWRGLQYEECTWEAADLVRELAQDEIDRYLNRSAQLPVSRKSESNLSTRSPYKRFTTQPDYIKFGELREFQITGINFLAHQWCKGHNVILADEMGLGKTVQTVSFINWLRHDRGQQGPMLVVVPLSTLPAWADTFNNWTPDINYVVYMGKVPSRQIIQEYELLVDGNPKKTRFHVLLTTYEYVLRDHAFLSSLNWQFLAVDEAHRLKNRDSELYQHLFNFNVPSRLLITGTPMQNTLGELSALMDFLMPGKIHVGEIDLGSEEASQKLMELNNAISPFMIRRTKTKVENDLPPKTEQILRVELSDTQLDYYKNILTRNYAALNAGAKGQKQSLLNIMMELKKASNHPFLFPTAEERLLQGDTRRESILKALITSSGKMMLLDRLLAKLKKDNHRVLIFSQMVHMLNILGDYLQLRGYQFQRLDGTISSAARKQAIDHFNAPDSADFTFLLSTRAGGLGINLMTADTVILYDSDWNPQADLQAMARAHRIGQKKPVTVYRFLSKDTVEEEILERARNKQMLEFITIQRGVTDKDAAKELTDKITKAGVGVEAPDSADDINRILKRRGQKMFEQSGNQKRLEELDIDAVLADAEEHKTEQPTGLTSDGGDEFLKSFEYTDVKLDLDWDDIIPKDQLEAIKEEERKIEEEKYLADMIEQNAPRKRKAPVEEREQRAAKKQARAAAREVAVEDEVSDDESGPAKDPSRPLNEKETRNLIRAFEKYGSLDERGEEMIRDAKLVGRDEGVLRDTLQQVKDKSVEEIEKAQKDLEEKERQSSKQLTKKARKAVLFDFKGVKRINAETILERPSEMQMLKEVIGQASSWRNFRVPEAQKPANYTCEWGVREDGMLLIGINRHGYGAWAAIRDDAELGMTDKFYLEEQRVDKKEERNKGEDKNAKSPGAVHLVRRANYLLSVLKDKTSNGTNLAAKRALENHHRNNKKWASGTPKGRTEKNLSVSASPAGSGAARKRESDKGRHRAPSNSDRLRHGSADRRSQPTDRNGTPEVRRKQSGEEVERIKAKYPERPAPQHSHKSADRFDSPKKSPPSIAEVLAPIQESLDTMKGLNQKRVPDHDKRLATIKRELKAIGGFIKSQVRDGCPYAALDLWNHVASKHWAKKDTAGSKLLDMYNKISDKEKHGTNGAAKTEGPSKDGSLGKANGQVKEAATAST